MKLLDYYIQKNNDVKWFEKYVSTGKGNYGKMFEYINTNFRTQNSFIDQFIKFLTKEGLERKDWGVQDNHKQEEDKQRVVNMLQSRLFKKDKLGLYKRTIKGLSYSNFIANENFNEDEQWFINYIYLLNGYYTNKENYIFNRVNSDLLTSFLSVLSIETLKEIIKNLLKSENRFSDIVKNDFLYMHSFYNDNDFLQIYFKSNEEEKEEFYEYIENNRKNETFNCVLSKKYKSGGVFGISSLFDDAKVLLLTILIKNIRNNDLNLLFKDICNHYDANLNKIDINKVFSYYENNKDIFDSILSDVYSLEEESSEYEEEYVESDEEVEDKPEEYIDDTNQDGKRRIKQIFMANKNLARKESNNTCVLEKINNCKPIYFTSKKTNLNYTEIHHLIPQEFRNNFTNSIEVVANYITLCPRCHKQIHLAVDRERKHLINALFNDRIDRLKKVGLNTDLLDMYEFYKIEK